MSRNKTYGRNGRGVGGHGIYLSMDISDSDTAVIADHQLESRQEYLTTRKEYIEPCKTARMKEQGGNRRVSKTDLPSVSGGTEAGVQSQGIYL